MRKYTVMLCQMNSRDDKEANLKTAGEMVDEAAQKGARVVAFPEMMNFCGRGYRHQAEPIPGPTSEFLCQKAREKSIWVVGGSFPQVQEDGRPKNTMLLIDPNGTIRGQYSKIHMYDVEMEDGTSFHESGSNTAGDEIVLVDTPLGRWGFALCYDLRFGEMFRIMAIHGARVIYVPSSFMVESGRNHWESLLRARAIENGVYIVAPNQIGKKANTTAYGNSMVVDPWGNVIARASDRACCVQAEIDLDYIDAVRRQIPSLDNRREDVYQLCSGAVKIY